MNVVLVYLRLYGAAAVAAFKGIIKNPWTLALPMAIAIAAQFAASLVAPLGQMAGGFVLGLAEAAAFSAYLYFTGEVVARSTTSVSELKKSFGVYFWSVISVRFVLWIAEWALGAALEGNPKRVPVGIAISMLELVALNAVPETIYIKGTRSGIDTIMASFQFLQENWIEWFIPNGLIIGGIYFAVTRGFGSMITLPITIVVVFSLLTGVLFHLVMVFRGTLFLALDGSSHRQRMYRYRTGA